MRSIGKIIALCCYVAILVAPIGIHLMNVAEDGSAENRKLNSLPKWPDSIEEFKSYSEKVNAYLEDNFGLRTIYIETANRINYHLFNELVSKQITVGKDGYIFFNSHSASQKDSLLLSACGLQVGSVAYRLQVENDYKTYLNYLGSKGVVASLAIIPIKARVYPEKLPPREQRWCNNETLTWTDKMWVNLINSGYSIYHPLSLMRKLKADFQVYLPSYFHWHGKTPKVIAIDMMNKLWGIEAIRFNIAGTPSHVESDLHSHLVGLKLGNDSFEYDYSIEGATTCTSGKCLPELDRFFKRQSQANTYQFDRHNEKVLVMTTDSFGAYVSAHFLRGFGRVIQIDISGIDKDKILPFYEYLFNQFQPTHFLNLIHEGAVWGSSVNNQKLSEQLLKQSH